jgi:hypothetical protein
LDVTGSVSTDIDGTVRTAATGVTVGAYELDDSRELGDIVAFGASGGNSGLLKGIITDTGTGISVPTWSVVVPDGAVQGGEVALDAAGGVPISDVAFHEINPSVVSWTTENGASETFIFSADYDLAANLVQEVNLSNLLGGTTGTPENLVVINDGGNDRYVIAAVNDGLYSWTPAAPAVVETGYASDNFPGSVAFDGTDLWSSRLVGADRLLSSQPVVPGGVTDYEYISPGTGRLLDLEYDRSTDRLIAVVSPSAGSDFILVDDATTPASFQTEQTGETIFTATSTLRGLDHDDTRDVLYYSAVDGTISIMFEDGFWGGTDGVIDTLNNSDGQFDVRPLP